MKNVGSLLPITVYPHLELLLGYAGGLRFVIFDTTATGGATYHDGAGSGACSPDGWLTFARHPQVDGLLALARLSESLTGHCLLLDREKRQLYALERETAESLLSSEKNRIVVCEGRLIEKLEGLFGMKVNLDLLEPQESPIGSREHFMAWMARSAPTTPH